jgi:fatty acid/phospholipid biosynthesis enzyme
MNEREWASESELMRMSENESKNKWELASENELLKSRIYIKFIGFIESGMIYHMIFDL